MKTIEETFKAEKEILEEFFLKNRANFIFNNSTIIEQHQIDFSNSFLKVLQKIYLLQINII